MATEDIVRISYKELENVAINSGLPMKRDSPQNSKTNESKVASHKKSRSKRPARQIYRPGQLKQTRGSRGLSENRDEIKSIQDNDGEISDIVRAFNQPESRENSSDICDSDIQVKLENLTIQTEGKESQGVGSAPKSHRVVTSHEGSNELLQDQDSKSRSKRYSDKNESNNKKKSSKRPDMQVYVPRAKLRDRENKSEDKEMSPSLLQCEDWDQELAERNGEDVVGSGDEQPLSPRQVKSSGGAMKVTVLNESLSPGDSKHQSNPKTRTSSQRLSEGYRETTNHRKGFGQSQRSGKSKYQDSSSSLGSRSRGEERNPDQPVKSYTRMRRSNSSDSRRSENDVVNKQSKETDKGQFSSDTFPRTKMSGKERKSQIREMYSASKGNKESSSKGREGEKFYWGMRRQRTGSISSEASFVSNMESSGSFYSGSSDFYTEDDEPEHILDWGEEVEKAHLEELARLVHDGAQKLTSSLGVYPDKACESVSEDVLREEQKSQSDLKHMSASADKIYQINSKERRHRRRHRHRKPPSQQSSRDSSVHSTAQSDHSTGGGRRRRRRRHSSQHSQHSHHSDVATEDMGQNNLAGLQVTIGGRSRHVELNKSRGTVERGATQEQADWDGEKSVEFNRSEKGQQKWQKEPPPRFRHDSDGRHSDTGGRRVRRENTNNRRQEGERFRHYSEDNLKNSWGGESQDWRRSDDQRSVHPAHDSSSSYGSKGHSRDKFRNERRRGSNSQRSRQGSVNNDDFDIAHKMRGGGLLRLPTPEEPPRPHSTPSASEYQGHHPQRSEEWSNRNNKSGASHSRGQGGGERHLFDPDNPSKPIIVGQNQEEGVPTFENTDEAHSPGAGSGSYLASSPESLHNNQGYPPHFYPDYPSAYHYRPPMQFRPQGPFPMGGYPPQSIPPMFYRFPRMPMPDMNFYRDGDGEGMSSVASRAQCRMMAEQILRDSLPFGSQLGNILSRRPHSEDSYRMLNQIRGELQHRLEQVILLDIEVANKQSVEQSLWKSVYYQVIETLRKRVSDEDKNIVCKQRLKEVLDEGTRFFENLLKKLQSSYDFCLDQFIDPQGRDTPSRSVKLGLLSAQRIMMFLGDIARYREQLADTTNYGKARHWYLKAQKIHPRNGRPYNQLAILAVYTRRKLDAVYYYMRSLAASNPIMTARESLMSLFDEVRRKVDAIEKKKFQERSKRQSLYKKQPNCSPRVEIWVSPDGSSVEDSVKDGEEEEDLSALSPIELNKRFVLTYLNVHGKLFTKINFEVFAESSSLMLHEFATLIDHTPCVLSSTRLLQLMVINMFSIDNTALKDSSLEDSCRSLLQEHAVEIGLEMFGLLVQRCSELLKVQMEKKKAEEEESKDSTQTDGDSQCQPNVELCADLHSMLPALKTWVDWMMCHADLWNPQPLNRPPELGPHIDVWKNLALFCDLLNKLETKQGCLIREEKSGYQQVVLQEDSMLAGFVPMLSAPQEIFFATDNEDKRQIEDLLRIEKLRLFGEYLCGVEPAMLGYNVESGCYYSIAPSAAKSEEKLISDNEVKSSGDESEDVVIESDSNSNGDSDGDDHIEKLKAKRGELHRKKEERQRNKENVDAIIDRHRQAKIELEIRPLFLIPDTNCFIDHFSTLKKLLETKKYTLVVPLVVINELDGLSRGARDQQYDSPDHAAMVKAAATTAVQFLEDQFEAKNSHLRAQTSKGTIMETISFRSEEMDPNAGINDDTILSCCKHYCKDNARDFMPKQKDQPVRLYRDVVLLTEDRNLRLKAHASNVPVKDVIGFKKWSKIP